MASHTFVAAVAVRDMDASIAWYGKLLGQAPATQPMESLAEWYAADDNVLQIVGDPERAGHALLTIMTDNLGGFVAAARERGVEIDDPAPGAMAATVRVADPEGNLVTVAQPNRP